MSPTKPLERVAVVGATGHIGEVFVAALLKTGQHSITALTRADSKGVLPEGVKRMPVDYDSEESLVSALQDQQFLVITLPPSAPPTTHGRIVRAAARAGVAYVMPNFHGADIRNPSMFDGPFGALVRAQLDEMEELGVSYVSLACGTWYEWSLALGEAWFGFDIPQRRATLVDDGATPLSVSTWPQCGRALAALLSLPESGTSPCLADWRNAPLYVSSFRVSQRDMLDSLHRVLGTNDADWEIRHEPAEQRDREGREEFARGVVTGFAKSLYAKLFMRARDGVERDPWGTDNKALGLPEESLDEATRKAVEMVESGWNPLAR
ncbi:hypothetical protein GGR56DRAFT_549954 [Xylariaceae sp. FL0804]|nr:hypothetical protein GGR56DRAFT_549954 [Xylariaceae sp. FL0804]